MKKMVIHLDSMTFSECDTCGTLTPCWTRLYKEDSWIILCSECYLKKENIPFIIREFWEDLGRVKLSQIGSTYEILEELGEKWMKKLKMIARSSEVMKKLSDLKNKL